MKIDQSILPVSINDLKDKYFDGLPLTKEEKAALANFDRYRIQKLNSAKSDKDFKFIYLKIQAMANISSFRFFLKPEVTESILTT